MGNATFLITNALSRKGIPRVSRKSRCKLKLYNPCVAPFRKSSLFVTSDLEATANCLHFRIPPRGTSVAISGAGMKQQVYPREG